MKRYQILIIIGLLLLIAAVEIPQFWPMENGDRCYTYFASISCVSGVQNPTNTEIPPVTAISSPTGTFISPTGTFVPFTPTNAPTALPSPSSTPSKTPTTTATVTPTASATIGVTVTATRTQIPPTSTPIVINLTNGDFEDGLYGWTKFDLNGFSDVNSEVSPPGDTLAVYSGSKSARFLQHYSCYRSGVYQVINTPIGRNLTITAHYLTMGSTVSGLHNADPNMNSEIAIGTDRYGLTDPSTTDVTWKIADGSNLAGPLIGGNYEPRWSTLTYTVRTLSDRTTLYFYVDLGKKRENACMWGFGELLGFIDGITVTVQ